MAFVIAVHNFETTDGRHRVTFSDGKKRRSAGFSSWEFAEKFANYKAKRLGLEEYQVDEPERIHTMVKVHD